MTILNDGPCTLAAKRDLLRSRARERREAPTEATHPSLAGADLALAWDEYLDARNTADALEVGDMAWQQFEPDLTCPDRQVTAWRDAEEWAAGALDVLLYGTTRGTGN